MSAQDNSGIDNNSDFTPLEIREEAKRVTQNLLPDKSREKYEKCYNEFAEWQKQQKTTSFSEDIMLVYFEQLTKNLVPSTVWSRYSMLKSVVSIKHRIDMSRYRQLVALLAKNSKTHKAKKSKILEPKHIERFLIEAPDSRYLAVKVALILGVAGACRREELKKITIRDIEQHENMILVKIPNTKNGVPRKFTVDGDFYKIFKQYEALRPKDPGTDQFFLSMRDGKCTKQVIGINTFGAMPKVIAEFLHLEEPEKYTGHSFRRASATMLADAGADVLTLKRHGGWKSDQVAMGYVGDSIASKKKICAQISGCVQLKRPSTSLMNSDTAARIEKGNIETPVNLNASTSRDSGAAISDNNNSTKSLNENANPNIQLHNCQVTFHFNK